MRHYFFTIVLFLMCLSTAFSADYAIFKIQGDVFVKKAGDATWRSAARRDALNSHDMIRLGEKSSVMIINTESGQLFKSYSSGEQRVYDIVSSAKLASASMTVLACQELGEEIKNRSTKDNDLRVGAVYRGNNDMSFLDSLAVNLFADNRVGLSVIEEDGGMAHFALKNLSSEPLFVNVVRVSSSGSRHVCFEFKPGSVCEGLLLPPGVSMELPQYVFALDGSTFQAFATTFKFDTRALQRRL